MQPFHVAVPSPVKAEGHVRRGESEADVLNRMGHCVDGVRWRPIIRCGHN